MTSIQSREQFARSKKQQIIDIAVIALLIALAQSNLIDVYANSVMWFSTAISSTLLGTVIAFSGIHPVLRLWWQLVFLALGQFVIGPVIALPSTTIAHVIPSPQTLRQGWEMTFGAFKYLIAIDPPIGISYGSLMALWTIGLWMAFLTGAFTVDGRAWMSLLAAIPPAAAMAVCALLGTAQGWQRTLCGIAFPLTLILWISWRLNLMEWHRWLCALGISALATGLALGSAILMPQHRLILRDKYNPPLSVSDYASPLSGMRSYIKDHYDETLLTATNLPANTPVRLAVMDRFDGSVWNLSDSSDVFSSSSYQRVGSAINADELGTTFTATFTVHQGLTDVWLPLAGAATSVRFPDESEAGPLYYNRDTDSAILPSGTGKGLTYTESGIIVDMPTDRQINKAKVANTKQPETQDVPDSVITRATTIAGGQSSTGAAAQDLAEELRNSGWFSHGLQDDYPSAAGHGNYRVNNLLTGNIMVGDSEQYASAMALMARELGLPSRVVLGFLPKNENGDITSARTKKNPSGNGTTITFTGNDMTAWVEIKLHNLGWVPFYPTPAESKTPNDSQSPTPPNPKTLVRQPPVPLTDPLRDQQQARGHSDISGKNAENEATDESFWIRFRRAAFIVVVYGSPLWIALIGCGLILVSKAFMLARAQRHGTPRTRIVAGWNAICALAAQSGLTVSGTRSEQANIMASQFNMAGRILRQLSREADYAVFSGQEIKLSHSAQYWANVRRLRKTMLGALPRRKRLRALLSVRKTVCGKTRHPP